MRWEKAYLRLVREVALGGFMAESRAGATRSVPGAMLRIPLDHGFPLLTTRKLFTKGIFGELAAFLQGARRLADFEKFGCNYWRDNAAGSPINKGLDEKDWLVGKVYGAQWLDFNGMNQIEQLVKGIKQDPQGRRHIVTAWNPAELDQGVLPPCHVMFQMYVREGGLYCIVTMRSVDLCVGLPSDIALYALLTMLIAKDTGLSAKGLVFMLGDCHVYENHVALFNQEQYYRPIGASPELVLSIDASVFNFTPDMASIQHYDPQPAIKYIFNP